MYGGEKKDFCRLVLLGGLEAVGHRSSTNFRGVQYSLKRPKSDRKGGKSPDLGEAHRTEWTKGERNGVYFQGKPPKIARTT